MFCLHFLKHISQFCKVLLFFPKIYLMSPVPNVI
uniref:Uncharacterized protein n=1 Tax=Anguilla anguilla TaxID=7936 RepID=A0A0E9RZ77_ANGAN